MVLLSNLAPNPSAEMLSCVSKHKKAAMCLMEKIHVLDELRSGMTFSAPSCELNVHEPKLSNKVSKQKHSLNKITYWWVEGNIKTSSSQEANPVFPLGAMIP